jgi:mono/diheme cytochrome c family protein
LVALLAALGLALAALVFALENWTTRAQARKLPNPYPPTMEALAAGLDVYTEHCRSCHGLAGDGKGEKAPELSVAPGDFTNRAKMAERADGELYWQITHGRRPMPSFADKLNEQQRWEVVDYIRTFADRAKGPATAAPEGR